MTQSLHIDVIGDEKEKPFRGQLFSFVRCGLAFMLLLAAGLNCYQLSTSPVPGTTLFEMRWFRILEVKLEIVLGIWFATGVAPVYMRRVGIALFSLFAITTLTKVLQGHASCGCFGLVEVNPWVTFAIDCVAVALLLICQTNRKPFVWTRKIAIPVCIGLLACGATIISMTSYKAMSEESIHASNLQLPSGLGIEVMNDGKFVILEPEKWPKGTFPLIDYVDIKDQISTGEWVIVLYRHDCSHCIEELPKYEYMMERFTEKNIGRKIALIELPPYGSLKLETKCIEGRLDDGYKWFVQTPVLVTLD